MERQYDEYTYGIGCFIKKLGNKTIIEGDSDAHELEYQTERIYHLLTTDGREFKGTIEFSNDGEGNAIIIIDNDTVSPREILFIAQVD